MSSTPEQLAAIQQPNENKLIIALPGSGKTHTTVSLAEQITNNPANTVLMVTFTNAAAAEMNERVHKRLSPDKASRVSSMTFAKLFLEQFRSLSNGRKLLMGGEQANYIRRTAVQLKVSYDSIPIFSEFIEKAGRLLHFENDQSLSARFFIEYQNLLALFNRVDLNMVTREVILALQAGKLKHLPYTHIIVDEFQDTDDLQYQWMLTHKQPDRFFCVVGDDDQSIYSWRGAVGFENMRRFREDFNASTYALSTCFRCAPYILGAAQRLIEHGDFRLPKSMRSSKSEMGSVKFLVYPQNYVSEYSRTLLQRDIIDIAPKGGKRSSKKEKPKINYEPYRYVTELVEKDYFNWAILARTNLHLDHMEMTLAEKNIPVMRLGGKSIFDSPHSVGMIKLLYGITNPRAADHLADGLGWLGEDLNVIQSIYQAAKGIGFGAMSAFGKNKWMKETATLQTLAHEWESPCTDDVHTEARISKFFDILTDSIEHHQYADYKSQLAISLVCKNVLSASKGDLNVRAKSLLELVTAGASKSKEKDRTGKIVLCTLTGSKGLQFPKVFIINVDRDVIPFIKDDEMDIEGKIREERRLLYVGMTRAEEELVLIHNEKKPSMFIEEIGF